ncbi:MAG: triacylglycerol lipase [Deltaproteobacteria bacterium]|nr:MAG: triacylglycerol lipase [Deltaproteobacteria bacterium]
MVLAHGAAGFDSLFGILDYWFGIPEDLAAGGAKVYVTEVSQFNTPEVRGEQLIAQLEQIRAITGKAKVNLIGHSQGGLDVRYVAAVRPDLVASVTTIGAPHQGTQVADYLDANFLNGGFTQDVIANFANTLGTVIGLLSGSSNPQDAIAGIRSLTSAQVAEFNASYPQGLPATPCAAGNALVNGIRYYSWTGTGVLTNSADLFDGALGVASLFASEANDGLVGRCSAHLGQVIRDDYLYNHLDEVNQITALVSPFEANPLVVFRNHANRLKNAGL